jgi:hypothetical protein
MGPLLAKEAGRCVRYNKPLVPQSEFPKEMPAASKSYSLANVRSRLRMQSVLSGRRQQSLPGSGVNDISRHLHHLRRRAGPGAMVGGGENERERRGGRNKHDVRWDAPAPGGGGASAIAIHYPIGAVPPAPTAPTPAGGCGLRATEDPAEPRTHLHLHATARVMCNMQRATCNNGNGVVTAAATAVTATTDNGSGSGSGGRR